MPKKIISSICAILLLAVSFTGCGGKKTDIPLNELYAKIEETGLLPPMTEVDSAAMENVYGIDPSKLADHVFFVSEDTALSDEVAIFKVNDPEYTETLYGMLVSRVDAKARMAEGYSAEEYAKCKKTSVVRSGEYVYFIVNDGYDTLMRLMRSYIG